MSVSNRSRIIVLAVIATLLTSLSQSQQIDLPNPAGSNGRTAASSSAAPAVRDASVLRGVDFITDGSVEAGTSQNPFWAQSSTNFDYVICTVEACVQEGTTNPTVGPRTGTNWIWIGGAYSESASRPNEVGTISQPVRLTGGTVELHFYLWIGEHDPQGTDNLQLLLDDEEIFATLETNSAFHDDYTLVTIDLSSYADGTERILKFTGTDLQPTNTNFNIDDISILVNGVTVTPTEPPAATATPTPLPGEELLDNPGFERGDEEGKPVLDPWTLVKPSSDKIKCNKEDKIVAYKGDCAFRFKGVPGENSKLRQSPNLSGVNFAEGDIINVSLYLNAPGIPNIRAKVRIKYSDGTDKGKLNIDLDSTSDYEVFAGSYELTSGAVSSIRLSIDNKTISGKIYVDNASVKVAQEVLATNTPDNTNTPAATNTPGTPAATNTPGATDTPGASDTPGVTNTPTASETPGAATETPTETPAAETETPTETPGATLTPSATPTP